ncbi:transposase InsO family protein [Pseudoteredinibacter isoporae]|uniref:Transposase InsO family protein n=1 Tax=Pseudoteredinibacter isoporae TaxID=570281 RepID=A0A7X0JTA3_9GAMM|nr:transposase InsO family protein [Pseudoteredinibacter isoporae]
MKKTKYTEQQIAFALRQAEAGTRVAEVCRKIGISEATFHNWKKKYGGQRIHILLQREGWRVNHKKVLRIYREEGLNIRSKRPQRRVAAAHRMERPNITTTDQCWSMDSVADNLFDGKRIRALTIVDNFSCECMAIHVDHGISGEHVVGVIDTIQQLHGRCPERIQVDNGSEFISKVLDK